MGDAALEPFWPQGLGSNRGFHLAMNAVYSVLVLRESHGDFTKALAEQNRSWICSNFQTWHEGSMVLNRDVRKWTADYGQVGLYEFPGPPQGKGGVSKGEFVGWSFWWRRGAMAGGGGGGEESGEGDRGGDGSGREW